MAVLRSDIRTRARDYLNESVADIFTDDQLNRYFLEELRSLPSKEVYLEEIWSTTTVQDQRDYTLPEGTFKVELVEQNEGTSSNPYWTRLNGVDNYAGAIYLPYNPSGNEQIRIHIKKYFDEVSDDVTNLTVPDDKSEIVVWGVVIRAYRQFIGYLRNNQSWDTVTKPGDHNITVLQSWLRDAKQEYNDLIKQYARTPRPRDIDLVG
jgi:hypothetical protein